MTPEEVAGLLTHIARLVVQCEQQQQIIVGLQKRVAELEAQTSHRDT